MYMLLHFIATDSDCPSESESVMSDSMLVTIPYPLVHQQPSKSSIGNHSLFPTEASKGRSAITCARSTPTVEESNCSPNIQDSEEGIYRLLICEVS